MYSHDTTIPPATQQQTILLEPDHETGYHAVIIVEIGETDMIVHITNSYATVAATMTAARQWLAQHAYTPRRTENSEHLLHFNTSRKGKDT